MASTWGGAGARVTSTTARAGKWPGIETWATAPRGSLTFDFIAKPSLLLFRALAVNKE